MLQSALSQESQRSEEILWMNTKSQVCCSIILMKAVEQSSMRYRNFKEVFWLFPQAEN